MGVVSDLTVALTEEQARERWCPFSRVAYGAGYAGATSFNRLPGHPLSGSTGCVASDCMAWAPSVGVFSLVEGRFLSPGENYDSRDPNYEQRPNGKGSCGLVRGSE